MNSEQKLDKMEEQINIIIDQQLIIIKQLERLNNNCGRFDDHINLVEDVYDVLKTPLDFIIQRVNSITGEESKSLPSLEYKNAKS